MRDFTFQIKSGFSALSKRSPRMKSSILPLTSYCKLIVNLPLDQQMTRHHPNLIARLEDDWGDDLSKLKCSTVDFGLALHEGRVSLGHVIAEIYCLCLDRVTEKLNHGYVDFEEIFTLKIKNCTAEKTIYQIRLFFSEELPPQFSGLEHMVVGYLNKAIEDEPFDIEKRLEEFVAYRSNPT